MVNTFIRYIHHLGSPPVLAILVLSSKTGSGQLQWQSAHQTLHILSWLMMGALSHNTIHSVAADVRSMASSGGTCHLLKALLPRETDVMNRFLAMTRTVLQAVVSSAEQEVLTEK